MKIAFFTDCIYDVSEDEVSGCDAVVFPFFYGGAVSFSREIKGESDYFKRLANLSKCLKTAVIAGVDTNSYGLIRHSCAVCDGGRLLGISDMNYIYGNGEYTAGSGFKVYDTRAGRIGVMIGDDGFFHDCARTLCLCGADVLLHISDPISGSVTGINARAKAYELGVPIGVCAHKCAMLVSATGEEVFTSPKPCTVASICPERSYNLLTMRRRGQKKKSTEE